MASCNDHNPYYWRTVMKTNATRSLFLILAAVVMGVLALTGVPVHAGPVVYEGFDYPRDADGELFAGQGGTTDIGLDGTWTVLNSDSRGWLNTYEGTLPYGTLPQTGGYVSAYQNYDHVATRSISSTALDGLLDDGGELWFSFVAGWGSSASNMQHIFSIGTDGLVFSRDLANSGNGFGVWLRPVNNNSRLHPQASYWSGGTMTSTPAPNPGAIIVSAQKQALIVGQLLWGSGGADDTLNLYLPDTALVLGVVRSTIQADLDQSAFDTLSFRLGGGSGGSAPDIDEIRFGGSYADVIGPPIPEPASLVLLGLCSGLIAARRRPRR